MNFYSQIKIYLFFISVVKFDYYFHSVSIWNIRIKTSDLILLFVFLCTYWENKQVRKEGKQDTSEFCIVYNAFYVFILFHSAKGNQLDVWLPC